MILLVKNVQNSLRFSVLYVIIDGERHALDRVLQVWLGHGAVVNVDCGARGRLLQGHKVPEGLGVGQLHLGPFPHHPISYALF